MRDKRIPTDLATCRRLLKKYGDKKLSGVIKQLEAKSIPGKRGRPGLTDAELLEVHSFVEVVREDTGCSLTEARRRYAKFSGKKERYLERLHPWADRYGKFIWSDQELARAKADMRSQLRPKRVLGPTLKSPQA
jgi:hypothetical protein